MISKLPKWVDLGLIPLLNLATALIISGFVIHALGADPFYALYLLWDGAFGYGEGVSYTLYYTTHFVFTGLAVSVAFRAGLFNIGGEGQAMIGGLGLLMMVQWGAGLPAIILVPLAIMAAMAFGALWAFIPAYLQAKRNSHVVITTIMFNFIAASLLSYALVGPLRRTSGQATESEDLPDAARFSSLGDSLSFLGFPDGPANASLFIALACLVFYGLFMNRARLGYDIRVTGFNPGAATFAGISRTKIIIVSMLIAGGFAALLSVNEVMGVQHRLVTNFTAGFGFVGIAVAFMGKHHPFGIFLAALLFGVLYQGGAELSIEVPEVTRDMIIMIQGLVILLSGALEHIYRTPLEAAFQRFRKEGGAP